MRRVLQINSGDVEFGGVEILLMNQLKAIDKSRVKYDFWIPGEIKNDSFRETVLANDALVFENHIPKVNLKYYLFFYKRLKAFLKSNAYDTVQITTGSVLTMAICLKAMKKCGVSNRIAFCQNSGTPSQSKTKEIINACLKKFVCRNANWLMYPSMSACEWGFGIPKKAEKYKMLYNFIDVEHFAYNKEYRNDLRRKYDIDDEEFVVGHIGRFEKQKNHEFLVEVFASLREKNVKARLLLIGNGSLEEGIKQQLESFGITNTIFVDSTPEVYKYFSMMDVFFFPSVYEGLGIVAVEAQSNGLPVIMSTGVPDEAIVLENVVKLDLSEPKDKWTDALAKTERYDADKAVELISGSAYNIFESIKELYKVYNV